jgi:hypothetical protein
MLDLDDVVELLKCDEVIELLSSEPLDFRADSAMTIPASD